MRQAGAASTVREAEQGYVLVGLIVAIFIILLLLGIAAPKVARELRREQEVEAIHRGNQYVQGVRRYYMKVGHYPGSMEQLEKTNNIRFLRQKYVDPMTGKANWKLIHVGEAKTTVKGFFGKPLSGLPGGGGLGSAAGMASSGAVGAGAAGNSGSSSFGSSSFGSPGGSAGSSPSTSSFGSSSFGSPSTPSTGSTTGGPATVDGAGSSTSSSTGISSQSATSFTGTGAPIMGVGTSATGTSITVLNEQTTYPKWEFIYDPRIEQLKAKASLLGGGPSSTNATGLGSNSGSTMPGFGGSSTTPGSGSGTGNSNSSGSSSFGSSSFGSGSSSGFGSSGTGSSTPTSTPTNP